MKVDKEYISHLARRDAELEILQREQIRNSFIEMECTQAWIEMMFKVKGMADQTSEPFRFWNENLLTLHKMFDEARFIRNEYLSLEVSYNNLYNKYKEILNINLELNKKLSIFEEEFNK